MPRTLDAAKSITGVIISATEIDTDSNANQPTEWASINGITTLREVRGAIAIFRKRSATESNRPKSADEAWADLAAQARASWARENPF